MNDNILTEAIEHFNFKTPLTSPEVIIALIDIVTNNKPGAAFAWQYLYQYDPIKAAKLKVTNLLVSNPSVQNIVTQKLATIMDEMTDYRTSAAPLAITEPEQTHEVVNGGSLIRFVDTECRREPPGFWSRLWHRIKEKDKWGCGQCGQLYEWSGVMWHKRNFS